MLERDHYVSFANCGLPYHVGGAIPDATASCSRPPRVWPRSLALDVRTAHEVVYIDRTPKRSKFTTTKQDRTYREGYDKLVLCPGASRSGRRSRAPTTRASTCSATSPTWTASLPARRRRNERGRRRRQLHRPGAHGGFRATWAPDHRGRADGATDAVARSRDDPGPRLRRRTHGVTSGSIRRPSHSQHGDRDRLVVDLSDGTSVEADVVVMAAGARPNVDLARSRPRDRPSRRHRRRSADAYVRPPTISRLATPSDRVTF